MTGLGQTEEGVSEGNGLPVNRGDYDLAVVIRLDSTDLEKPKSRTRP